MCELHGIGSVCKLGSVALVVNCMPEPLFEQHPLPLLRVEQGRAEFSGNAEDYLLCDDIEKDRGSQGLTQSLHGPLLDRTREGEKDSRTRRQRK